jgi:nucleotide-binding universal stress UspA family protein
MIRRVLVPLDGSELAERALVVAGDLAESLAATVVLARVVSPPTPGRFYAPGLLWQMKDAQTREAEAYLASAADRLRADRLAVETRLLHGDVAAEVVAEAKGCDLIVITSHGMSGLGSDVFGSTAQKLLYSASCPVLVVRCAQEALRREEEREEELADEMLLAQLPAAPRRETAGHE